ncbi:hybrid sensor histidine kinase/response regulator [Sphingomonas sp. MA1305]|uniref:hybrid sensor histidine kinase/response regulator n=1 Tax=Sphingomonas sp. MA1305 TaxID=2479204 RepID=UPI0018DFFECC|nr:hybrid sensor histidine kinase/response regulator [Sphingomonas sp. MA1305]
MIAAAPPESDLPAALGFLRGGGLATELILARDWTTHPLGSPAGWPSGLKQALGLVLNSPESMILAWGRDDLFFFFNETYCPLLGPRLDWAMGAPFAEVWADAWDQAKPIIDDAFAGCSNRFVDLPWKLDTDRGLADTWWTFSYSRVLDEHGEIAGLFIFTNETTARVLADRALARSQAELSALNATLERQVEERTAERDRMWNTSPDLMVVLSPDGIYRRINPAWRTVLGYEPGDVLGHFVTDFTHPDDIAPTEVALATAQVGQLPNFENRFRHADGGYRWLQWVAAPGPDEIFAVGRHVTDAKAAEARLQETEAQLRQAQKMEAVGQLTGGIAHDFNNMLTGVIGSLDLLRRRLGAHGDPRIDRYIDAATTSAQRAAGLTQRLLAFSRRQALDVRATDVNALAIGMEELLHRTLGENIALDLHLAGDAWPALTDGNQLESALLNLAINARDAMPDGGRLTLATGNAPRSSAPAAAFDGVEPGDYVMVSMTDTGTGMPADVAARAFDPFFTTKPIGVGTGLGLSMIYGFVRQTGGRVRIVTKEGEGTAIHMLLPRAETDPEPTVAPISSPMAARPGESVLLVEDDPAVRMLVADLLGDLGFRVRQARDGTAALAELEAMPRLDLLITDVGLPGMNGRDLADLVRARHPALKVLFISGYAGKATMLGDFLAEGMELVSKPFDIDALSARIRAILG